MRIEYQNPNQNKPNKPDKQKEFIGVKNEKRTLRSEFQKMKELGLKDGWEYFLNYYKWPVIVIVISVIVVISLVHSIILNSRPFSLSVAMYNTYSNESADSIMTEFTESIGLNTTDYQYTFESGGSFSTEDVSEEAYATMAKVMAQVSAKSLDLLGGDSTVMYYYGNGASDEVFFGDLRNYLSEDFYQWLEDEGRIFYCEFTDTGERYAAGVDVTGSRLYNEMEFLLNNRYLGIVPNSDRIENAVAFLEFIFEYDSETNTGLPYPDASEAASETEAGTEASSTDNAAN